MAKLGGCYALSTALRVGVIATGLAALAGCAEVEVGAEAVKVINSKVSTGAEAKPSDIYTPAAGSRVNPQLEPAPATFEARGNTIWDGARTLQGIWVAHPKAEAAMRVRIINARTGVAIDGALFRREAASAGPPVLISSETATALGLKPNQATPLIITALRPKSDPPVIAAGPEDEVEVAALDAEAELAEETAETVDETTPATDPTPQTTETAETSSPVEEAPTETAAVATTETLPAETEVAEPLPTTTETAAVETVPATPEPAETVAFPEPEPEPVAAAIAALPEPTPTEDTQSTGTFASVTTETPAELAPEPAPEPEAPAQAPVEVEQTASAPAAAPQEPVETITELPPELSEDLPTALYVRAGTFSVRENADRLVTRIRAAGYPATGRSYTSEGRELTSVTAGPFSTRRDQERALSDIRAMGLTDAFASQ